MSRSLYQNEIQTRGLISERPQAELSLLHAMYPEDSVKFNPTTCELYFKPSTDTAASLVLRLPDTYPETGRPQVISACDCNKHDLRKEVTDVVAELSGPVEDGRGGEVLDVVIERFLELASTPQQPQSDATRSKTNESTDSPFKTVIIWLHHLLATSKRKLALHPSNSSDAISGVTKPGYPGVMLFTGDQDAVDEHVAELKRLNWQAFQVRYEEDQHWRLGRTNDANGVIVEVETMAEVVQCIEEEDRREQFLKAVGVK
jgi:hypothetical protein